MRTLHPACAVAAMIMAAGLLPTAPAAAENGSASSDVLNALAVCQRVTANADRLACFDKAAEQIATASRSGRLLALDREKVIEQKRQRFGLEDVAENPLGGGEADRLTRVTEVQTAIVGIRPASYARFLLQLANNTVWETIEPLSIAPTVGTAITVRQAGLGGFKAIISGERPVLVKRRR
jgi:hypothetical protein